MQCCSSATCLVLGLALGGLFACDSSDPQTVLDPDGGRTGNEAGAVTDAGATMDGSKAADGSADAETSGRGEGPAAQRDGETETQEDAGDNTNDSGTDLDATQWGAGQDDVATAIQIAADGAAVLAGTTGGALRGFSQAGIRDVFVSKRDASGTPAWTFQAGSPGRDDAQGLHVAGDGTVYLAATVRGAFGSESELGGADIVVFKLDGSDGSLSWARRYGTSADDIAGDVVTIGNAIYVAGSTSGTLGGESASGDSDMLLMRLDVDGSVVWHRQFGSTGFDGAYGMASRADGALFVVGGAGGVLPGSKTYGGRDCAVVRFGEDGTMLWAQNVGGPGNETCYAAGLGGDGLYLAGTVGFDMLVARYDLAGGQQWQRAHGSTGNDAASALVVTDTGIWVAGSTSSPVWSGETVQGVDAVASRFELNGTPAETYVYGTGGDDRSTGIGMGPAGVVVMTGWTQFNADSTNAGSAIWVQNVDGG